MSEGSRFWDGTTVGDATIAPYDAGTEFARVMSSVSGAQRQPNLGAIWIDDLNECAPTNPSANTVRIASGRGIVYGTWYENDSTVDASIPTPAASTRIDRIVLRKSWASQTVRVTRIAGVEGGAAPALVQVEGTTWDFPICQASITTGGVITITDQRVFMAVPTTNSSGTFVFNASQPLTVTDTGFTVQDDADTTKQFVFQASGITTGTTRTYTVPNATGTLTLLELAQTWTAAQAYTVQSTTAFTVARTGTNYALQVDTNTASSATGLKITAAAAAGGLALAVISSGTNENLTIDAKGSGTITLGGTSTGNIVSTRLHTFSNGASITNNLSLDNGAAGTPFLVWNQNSVTKAQAYYRNADALFHITCAGSNTTGITVSATDAITINTLAVTAAGVLTSPHMTGAVVDSGGLTVTAGGVAITGTSTLHTGTNTSTSASFMVTGAVAKAAGGSIDGLGVSSDDAANQLIITAGLSTNATAGSRFGYVQVQEVGVAFRALKLQNSGGDVYLAASGLTIIGSPGSTSGAGAGDMVLATGKGIWASNSGSTAAKRLLVLDASDRLVLSDGTQPILWNRSLVASGGGAAPTFGTIGGSGPTTAGQWGWLPVTLNDGTAAFFAVWK